ncbi:hypothetical protein K2F33_30740 [Paenibacillus sp. PSB04]|nr:hypothetical protein K2F33_30740 [Paenibacillus sp. PSB04]
MASHSLQYVDDLEAVMDEIYRICRHKAVVCIVASYAHVNLQRVFIFPYRQNGHCRRSPTMSKPREA